MKPTRCAAWLVSGGNASYFPALLFARVGAEDPRYPRPLLWLPPLGEPGAFRPCRAQAAPWGNRILAISPQSRERTR